jgi:hypothetical protein
LATPATADPPRPTGISRTLDAEGRRRRARVGATARHHPDEPERALADYQALKAAAAERHIQQLVATWPPLTAAQRNRLAAPAHHRRGPPSTATTTTTIAAAAPPAAPRPAGRLGCPPRGDQRPAGGAAGLANRPGAAGAAAAGRHRPGGRHLERPRPGVADAAVAAVAARGPGGGGRWVAHKASGAPPARESATRHYQHQDRTAWRPQRAAAGCVVREATAGMR